MKTVSLLALGLVGALIQPAAAYTPRVCYLGLGVAVCGPMTGNPGAHIIEVYDGDEERDGTTETRGEWKARCLPVLSKPDAKTGMQRWTWAQPGCSLGPQ